MLEIWGHLSRRRQIQVGLLLFVMLASGVAELVSLGAVLPFLAVLSDPERLWKQPLVQVLAKEVGFTTASQLLLPATLAFALAAMLAALVRLSNLWLNGRLAAAVGSDLSCEAFRRTLYQPYVVHLKSNSSTVITGTTTHIAGTVQAFAALLQMVTAAMVAAGLLLGLIWINWPVALGAAGLFGTVYSLLAVRARKVLLRNSQLIAVAANQHIKVLQEGLGAIRDVLLDGNQGIYTKIYGEADRSGRYLQARNQFLGAFPRYSVEALGMVAIAFLGGFLVHQNGPGNAVIPLLGALALGAQRLLPALQQVYGGWSALKGFNADLAGVLSMLNQPLPLVIMRTEPLSLLQTIRLEGVHFCYGPEQDEVLRGLDLEICRGERIGLIGSTGSGKSSTLDLLMGLLAPTSGRVLVDGVDINNPNHPERLPAWRAVISHVPQSIYLADGSVAENIAFGVPSRNIDFLRVKNAAELAQIGSFIESTPDGYLSFVGERGMRLSGGQRQRIGIARALYKNAKVLILDEATSALDSETESAVMESLGRLRNDLTIIMVAHRLSTLSHCNRVIKLGAGVVEKVMSPQELLNC